MAPVRVASGDGRQLLQTRWLSILFAAHLATSLAHHLHNALWLHEYPNLPPSLSSLRVAGAWATEALIGLFGYLMVRVGNRLGGLVVLGVFGLFGFLGLAHYQLAPPSAHSIAMNASIIGEALSGASLVAFVVWCFASAPVPKGQR